MRCPRTCTSGEGETGVGAGRPAQCRRTCRVAWVEVRASALACAALPLGLHSCGLRVEEVCVWGAAHCGDVQQRAVWLPPQAGSRGAHPRWGERERARGVHMITNEQHTRARTVEPEQSAAAVCAGALGASVACCLCARWLARAAGSVQDAGDTAQSAFVVRSLRGGEGQCVRVLLFLRRGRRDCSLVDAASLKPQDVSTRHARLCTAVHTAV
jgi:hypothetical protein